MRILLVILAFLAALYFLANDPEPVPIEETVIGDQVRVLEDAKSLDAEYLKASEAHQRQLDQAVEGDSGD